MMDQPPRVILVEDNDDDADLVSRGVAKVSPEICLSRFSTISEATDYLCSVHNPVELPRLVFLDGRISGQDAGDFFSQLPGGLVAALPIVVLTGTVELRSRARYLDLGAREVRGKPIDYGEFLELIAEILKRYLPSS